jgi:hypothetical protein
VYVVALILSLGVIVWGGKVMSEGGAPTILIGGLAGLLAVMVSWPIALQLHHAYTSSARRTEAALTGINDRFEQFSVMLDLISEQQLLSDRAKSVAFREKDSDALRRAFQEELLKHNWDAAAGLANEMERSFGYKQEADHLREQIRDRQNDTTRKLVTDAAAVVERHMRGEAWPEAMAEAQRLAKAFPGVAMAEHLPQDVENRRQAHKKQLIDSWNDAVNRHDTDGAIEILKRLDLYLSPTEAEAYQETARSVFKEKLNNLRTQFSVAVQDHQWNEALRIGTIITRDFPNAQMAKEVREMMESLKARAGGAEPAAV